MATLSLEGRVCIVTGGADGIGLAIVRRLLAERAVPVVWDLRADAALIASLAPGLRPESVLHVDVSSQSSVEVAVANTLARFQRIDALVNNAGISGPTMPTWEYPEADWQRIVDVNLGGVFRCCKAVVPHMLAADRGRIVNLASVAGKEGNPNAGAYSASKGGVIALTKSLGKELALTPIRVNAVAPTGVRTAIFDQMSPEHVDYMLSKIPMGRFGTVEEVAAMVAWLCGDECSFSTGAVFDLSGGRATY